jgi:DNA-binding GntR family transcriptional regulator
LGRLGVARNTVANAFALLVAEGWFEAHRGRGTSVAGDLPTYEHGRFLAISDQGTLGGRSGSSLTTRRPKPGSFPLRSEVCERSSRTAMGMPTS